MRIEYLKAVTEVKRWYQITVPVADMDAVGRPIERQEKRFFQLLNRAPTFESRIRQKPAQAHANDRISFDACEH